MTTETLDTTPSLRDRVQSLRLPQRVDTGRTSRGGWLPWALTLLLALSTASLAERVYSGRVAVSDRMQQTNASASVPATTEKGSAAVAPPTQAAKPETPASGTVVLESKGYIIAAHQIQVSPIEVGGRVIELYVEEGKRFNKGDVLAVLDRTMYEAEVAETTFALAAAEHRFLELDRGFRPQEKEQVRNELSEAEEQQRKMYFDFKRAQELRGTGISNQEFEQAEMSYRAQEQRVNQLRKAVELIELGPREERVAAAKAEVEVARARLTKAKWRLENCTIRAPVDGTILTKKAEVGNLVNPLAFAATSGAVCEMADLSDLEVDLDITERDVSKVVKGLPCKVRSEAYPDRIYEGVVDRLMPIANRAKGAVPVRVKLRVPKDEEGVYLKPEMGAVVAFLKK